MDANERRWVPKRRFGNDSVARLTLIGVRWFLYLRLSAFIGGFRINTAMRK